MTRTQNRTVIVLGLACLYVLVLWLNSQSSRLQLALSAPPAGVRDAWAHALGQSLADYVIAPGLAVFGWPLGLWLWQRGNLIVQQRTTLRLMAVFFCFVSTFAIVNYLGWWFLR